MKELIERSQKELSLRLYAYYGKVEEDAGKDAEEFEQNCLQWLSLALTEAYNKGLEKLTKEKL